MKNEIWKAIDSYPGYLVSNLGRIKSLSRVVIRKNGYPLTIKGCVKTASPNIDGYLQVKLSKNNKSKTITVHTIVARAFIGYPPTPKHEVNHIDGNKENPCVDNLEYLTHKENTKYNFDILGYTCNAGENNGRSKLSDRQVKKIRKLFSIGKLSQGALGRMFKVSQAHISCIVLRKNRTDI